MSAIATKIQICNQALAILGVEEEVENIDKPTTRWEKRCALFYEPARAMALTLLIPTFAVTDEPQIINRTTDGRFPIPGDSLRILKVNGQGGDKIHEVNGYIKTDFPVGDMIEVIYLRDVKSTGLFTPEFIMMLANELAICLAPLTKDNSKINYAATTLVQKRREFAGINAGRYRLKKHSDFPFIGSGFFYRR